MLAIKLAFLKNGTWRHALVLFLAALLTAGFWSSRMDWDPEMRLWRAIGDVSLVFMLHALVVGPLAKIWSATTVFRPWRRETGIWCALLALVHTLLVFDGWFRWDLMRSEASGVIGAEARRYPGLPQSHSQILRCAVTELDHRANKCWQ